MEVDGLDIQEATDKFLSLLDSNLFFHPYLPLWILLSMHTEPLVVWQAHLDLLFPSTFPLKCPFLSMFSKSYPSCKAQLKQLLLHEALPYYSQLEVLCHLISKKQFLHPEFLSLTASKLVFYCTTYVFSGCCKFSEKEDCASFIIDSLEYQVPALIIIGKSVNEVWKSLFWWHTVSYISITINYPTPLEKV